MQEDVPVGRERRRVANQAVAAGIANPCEVTQLPARRKRGERPGERDAVEVGTECEDDERCGHP